MASMDDLRTAIDSIDNKIVELLDERAQVAKEIGDLKRKEGRPAFDGVRQKLLLDRLEEKSKGIFPIEGLRNVYTEIMSACRNLEEATRIAFLGPEATFTHQAAVEVFGASGEFIPCMSVPEIFEYVEKGRAHYGVVPIENSSGGVVYQTLDRFIASQLRICLERSLKIELHLLANCSISEIETIYSHSQPFSQCREWLQMNLPNVKQVVAESTVRGAELAAATPRSAAIAGELAAKAAHINIVQRGIQDLSDNSTRFWVIGRDTAHATGNDKTSILFFIKDRPGALYEVLKHMADCGINLTKIESRPSRRAKWQYAFFMDFLGHHEEERVRKALEKIEESCEQVRILGSYPRDMNT